MRKFIEVHESDLRTAIRNFTAPVKIGDKLVPQNVVSEKKLHENHNVTRYMSGGREVGRLTVHRRSVQALWLVQLESYLPRNENSEKKSETSEIQRSAA